MNQLEMGGMICGHLQQPVMRSLGGEWAEATQGTGQGMVQEDDKGESRE